MGVVYRAVDEETGRPVAIKVQHNTKPTPEQIQRFHREGVLTARLDHPGILRIHGGGITNDGSSFLILELVEGALPLDAYLAEHPEEGLQRILELAQALGYAHRQGIVHRDLKPANVLIDLHGRLRITDFGLAWASDADRLTKTKAMLGTPLYMAPECFERGRGGVVPASDVWSLGVLLYRELTGRLPFDASTLTALMLQVTSEKLPTPVQVDPRVGVALSAVCMRALSREVRHRYADAGEFADALEVTMLGGDPRRRRSKLPLLAAAVVVAFGGLAFALRPTPPALEPTSTATVTPTPPIAAVRDPALEELVQRTRVVAPRDPAILKAFEALRDRPDLTDLARRRVELERLRYLFRRGRWSEVLAAVPALENEPGDLGPEATILHAEVRYALRRPHEARLPRAAAPMRRALARREPIAPVLRRTIEAYLAVFEADAPKALARAEAALAIEPDRVSAVLAKAIAFGRMGRLAATLPILERVTALATDHPQGYILRVLALTKLERPEEALVLSKKMMTLLSPDPPTSMAICHLRVYANLRRPAELEEEARALLEQHPSSAMWRFVVAYAQAHQADARWRGWMGMLELRTEDPRRFKRISSQFVMPHYLAVIERSLAVPRSRIQAGVLFEQGVEAHEAKRLTEARSLLEQSARGGNARAMALLGESLALGWGGPKDHPEAVRWFRKAIEVSNNAYALFGLARCYEQGLGGLKVDKRRAIALLKRAADRGLSRAQVNLGNYYLRGDTVEKDLERAHQLFSKAAEAKDGMGMYNLGLTYALQGKPRLALLWYRKALALPPGTWKKAESDAVARDGIRRLLERHPELSE